MQSSDIQRTEKVSKCANLSRLCILLKTQLAHLLCLSKKWHFYGQQLVMKTSLLWYLKIKVFRSRCQKLRYRSFTLENHTKSSNAVLYEWLVLHYRNCPKNIKSSLCKGSTRYSTFKANSTTQNYSSSAEKKFSKLSTQSTRNKINL